MTLGQLSTVQDNGNGSKPSQQRSQDAADDQVCLSSYLINFLLLFNM